MMRQVIHTENAPAAVGPSSQAVLDGQVLHASGQIPVNPVTGEVIVEDIRAAAVQVMENAGAVLEAAGLDYSDIVKTTVFLTAIRCCDVVYEIYAGYFKDNFPARSCVQVAALPKNVPVEMEFIATRKS